MFIIFFFSASNEKMLLFFLYIIINNKDYTYRKALKLTINDVERQACNSYWKYKTRFIGRNLNALTFRLIVKRFAFYNILAIFFL